MALVLTCITPDGERRYLNAETNGSFHFVNRLDHAMLYEFDRAVKVMRKYGGLQSLEYVTVKQACIMEVMEK